MTSHGKKNGHESNGLNTSRYRRKQLTYMVDCGNGVRMDKSSEIARYLGVATTSYYPKSQKKKSGSSSGGVNNDFNRCVACDDLIVEDIKNGVYGIFAVETILFIPKKSEPKSKELNRFRIKIPRVCCQECEKDYRDEHNIITKRGESNKNVSMFLTEWKRYKELNSSSSISSPKTRHSKINPNESERKESTSEMRKKSTSNMNRSGGSYSKVSRGNNENENTINLILDNGNKQGHDSERDPLDDGFLICTQLVKTGGADQGGLQVGDVFVEFGPYSKQKFPGLKSIANLVRRGAGKDIPVVVWRKSETDGNDNSNEIATLFQKLALKLKPLQSHDADGGGVLGAVINTYPLPQMKTLN